MLPMDGDSFSMKSSAFRLIFSIVFRLSTNGGEQVVLTLGVKPILNNRCPKPGSHKDIPLPSTRSRQDWLLALGQNHSQAPIHSRTTHYGIAWLVSV
jgi:hypothetical protein